MKKSAVSFNSVSTIICFIFSFLALTGKIKAQEEINLKFLLGDWKGESICTGIYPNCHDEIVLYHITNPGNKPDSVLLSAYKIINGQKDLMGDWPFEYDKKNSSLTNEFRINKYHGLWIFFIKGDTITGTLKILPDSTIARNIKVKKIS